MNNIDVDDICCYIFNLKQEIKAKLYGLLGNKQIPYGWKVYTEIIEPCFEKYEEIIKTDLRDLKDGKDD